MSAPDVSVLLPYRNNAATIEQAIHSILAQRGVSFELVAVDDGSSDGGPALARACTAGLAHVLHASTGGVGIVGALGTALALARGAYIARMDGDDVAHPGRLALQYAALTRAKRPENLALVATRVRVIPEEVALTREGLGRYVAWQNALLSAEDHRRELFVESPVCHPSVMLTRASLESVGGYRDPPWPEDYDLWLRLDAAGYAMEKLAEVLLDWRMHATNLTFTSPRYAMETFREAKAPFLAARLRALGKPVAFWGAGPTGKRLARALESHGIRSEFFVDVDPRKVGSTARGAPVVSPAELARGTHTLVCAVGARGARALIRAELAARGYVEGAEYLFAS